MQELKIILNIQKQFLKITNKPVSCEVFADNAKNMIFKEIGSVNGEKMFMSKSQLLTQRENLWEK